LRHDGIAPNPLPPITVRVGLSEDNKPSSDDKAVTGIDRQVVVKGNCVEKTKRGELGFEVGPDSELIDCARNVELLRRLWLDRSLISGQDLGEGDPGDFDNGAWHIACHLLGAAGVLRSADGRLIWAEISHNPVDDHYLASASAEFNDRIETWPIASAEGRTLLRCSTVLGFVEGNSLGRTSAHGVHDSPTLSNLWRRQDFDQPFGSTRDGGKVWEHWCTTRDIRPSSGIGTSVLTAYISLVAQLGDLFPAVVARGRSEYAHPLQLCAMIRAGLVDERSAVSELSPSAIPTECEPHLLQATPAAALQSARLLAWDNPPRYYMFARRIDSWCHATLIRDKLDSFRINQSGTSFGSD
jgi:hypothetical protein